MKIFIISSKKFYDKIPEIRKYLENQGHVITLPNCYDDPTEESHYRSLGNYEHAKWKAEKINHSAEVIKNNDAVMVLNFEKNGVQNYIGGATFLEMYDAFKMGKKIYMYNGIPDGILRDEIVGFDPIIINADFGKIR